MSLWQIVYDVAEDALEEGPMPWDERDELAKSIADEVVKRAEPDFPATACRFMKACDDFGAAVRDLQERFRASMEEDTDAAQPAP